MERLCKHQKHSARFATTSKRHARKKQLETVRAVKRNSFGVSGRDLTKALKKTTTEEGFSFTITAEKKILREAKFPHSASFLKSSTQDFSVPRVPASAERPQQSDKLAELSSVRTKTD